MRQILVSTAGVGYHVQVSGVRVGHDQVVDDASGVVGEHGERAGVGLQVLDIADDQTLDELVAVFAVDLGLHHVAHVEQTAVGSRVNVRLLNAQVLVLDGHEPAGKVHYLSAILKVKIVKNGLLLGRRRGSWLRARVPTT